MPEPETPCKYCGYYPHACQCDAVLLADLAAAQAEVAKLDEEVARLNEAFPLSTGRTRNEARKLLGSVLRHVTDEAKGASHGCVEVTNAQAVVDSLIAARAARYAESQARNLPPAAVQGDTGPLTVLGAKKITKQIKDSFGTTLDLLVQAHDREAWRALGYSSWGAYTAAEFDFSPRRGYQLLFHAQTVKELDGVNNCSQIPQRESQTRPMTGLPAPKKRKAWRAAVKSAGGKQPTAKQVAAEINKMKPAKAHVVGTEQNLPMHTAEPKITDTEILDWLEANKGYLSNTIKTGPLSGCTETTIRGVVTYALKL